MPKEDQASIQFSIESEWTHRTGVWDGERKTFIDKTWTKPLIKQITMLIYQDIYDRGIVKFNGPTGFETYRLEDLKTHDLDNDKRFCICGGTINSWANCTVSCRDIHEGIKQYVKGK